MLVVILAGGQGSRLAPLTDEVAKPAVPFLGQFRLIDFVLSNVVNSGLSDVWVIQQYLAHTLSDHLSGGQPWDLQRRRGGLRIMPPFSGPSEEEGGFAEGNAHALALHAPEIEASGADVVVVLSADHIYRLDFAAVIADHLASDAAVTMVTTELADKAEATRYSNLKVNKDGQVTHFAYKPEDPISSTVATEVFVYDAKALLRVLSELEAKGKLGDYGHHLLPQLVEEGKARAWPLNGYWRDVGTLDAYAASQADFLRDEALDLHDEHWPFFSAPFVALPARLGRSGAVSDSFVCAGASVSGTAIRSVVGPNAVIEAGAEVRDSIVQAGAVIKAGAKVSRAIVDAGATISENAVVGGQVANARLCVVGAGATVEAGAKLPPAGVVQVRAAFNAGETAELLDN